MKNANTSRIRFPRIAVVAAALVVVVASAGALTNALASVQAPRNERIGAYDPGAAGRKAAELPREWRFEKKAASFDSMYAR